MAVRSIVETVSASQSEDFESRLIMVLDRYVEMRRQGSVDKQSLLEEHAEFSEELPGLLESLDALHGFHDDVVAVQSEQGKEPNGSKWNLSTNDDANRRTVSGGVMAVDATEGWRDLTATRLGDYEVVREIGRGGMGVVYEAHQISLRRSVALKVLPLSVILDPQQISRFMVECQAAASLQHPNIIPIYSIGCEDGLHCYSMQLIDGQSLETILERSVPAGTELKPGAGNADKQACKRVVEEEVRWAIQAAEALEHAHQRGVIHRDIKPSNLMIDQEGHLWITDFGLARSRTDSSLTRSGAVVGTWRYMSPEQMLGQSLMVDHRCDVYSLGLTLYEALVTKLGVSRRSEEGERQNAFREWSMDRRSETPVVLRRVISGVPRDLETIVMKAIAFDRDDRYESSGDLADDLRCFLEGKPIAARRPSIQDQLFKWTSRHRRGVFAALVLGLIGFVAAISASIVFAHQRSALDVALRRADTSRQEAVQRTKETRAVLDQFGLRAAEELQGIPGAQSVRQRLVSDLLSYYDALVAESEQSQSNDADSIREMADIHFRAARIIDELSSAKQAAEAYSRTLSLYRKLKKIPKSLSGSDVDADDIDFRMAVCWNNLAVREAELGVYESAKEHYELAIEAQSRLADSIPEANSELAGALANAGLLFSKLGDFGAAEDRLLRSRDLQSRLLKESSSLERQLDLATTHNNLGHLFQSSDVEKSLAYNVQCLELLDPMYRRFASYDPRERVFILRQLAASQNNHAALMVKLSRVDEATQWYKKSISTYRQLVRLQPWSVVDIEFASIALNNFGRFKIRTGENYVAEQNFSEAQQLISRLISLQPSETRFRLSLCGVLNNLAALHTESGDTAAAIKFYEQSIKQQEQLAQHDEGDRISRDLLRRTYASLESLLRDSGQVIEAGRVALVRDSLEAAEITP